MSPRKKKAKEDRREVSVQIPGAGFSLSEFDNQTVDDAIGVLQRLRESRPGKRLVLRLEQEPYCDYQTYNVYEHRPETDLEMQDRHAREDKHRLALEARERAEFERLQKKFSP